MEFKDIKSKEDWNDFVYEKAFIGNPDIFTHREHWEGAEQFVFDHLTEQEQENLELLGIV